MIALGIMNFLCLKKKDFDLDSCPPFRNGELSCGVVFFSMEQQYAHSVSAVTCD